MPESTIEMRVCRGDGTKISSLRCVKKKVCKNHSVPKNNDMVSFNSKPPLKINRSFPILSVVFAVKIKDTSPPC